MADQKIPAAKEATVSGKAAKEARIGFAEASSYLRDTGMIEAFDVSVKVTYIGGASETLHGVVATPKVTSGGLAGLTLTAPKGLPLGNGWTLGLLGDLFVHGSAKKADGSDRFADVMTRKAAEKAKRQTEPAGALDAGTDGPRIPKAKP